MRINNATCLMMAASSTILENK
ncbi:unnamed protein product [Aspergillus niger]|uniref:Contig An13c0120, genomic contig n=1 Tax=Aspergillus niger (strain ATCC MYA-4892 / CBS 513.88 / FGSC A1513) TaxID=425011 RepID=A2R270_ASPNC|nr:unnamed protein product [Aspergillus niger]